jgi:hypothetical protein
MSILLPASDIRRSGVHHCAPLGPLARRIGGLADADGLSRWHPRALVFAEPRSTLDDDLVNRIPFSTR